MKSITRNIGKNIIKISIIVFMVMLTTPMKSRAEQTITSKYYEIDKQKGIISRIEPETTIEEFKSKINEEIKIYEDKNCTKEIKAGNIGTGKYVKNGENIYETSVVGDFDGDGKATQEELTHIINHIVGLQGANLEGINYKSGDITGNGKIDQRDITKITKYIVYGELELGKGDVEAPEIELKTIGKTTNTITIEAKAQDKESGIYENATYTFWIKKANEPDNNYEQKLKAERKSHTFTGLKANETYTIKVEVSDKAGNKGEKTINVTTEPMPDIETEEGVLTFNPITWENEKASTTISTNTEHKIEYQVNEIAGAWTQATQPGESIKIENLKHNDKIYARLTDGINTTKIAIVRIEDKIAPELELKVTQETTKTIKIEYTAQDKESGIDTNATYKFYIKKANEQDSSYLQKQDTTSKTCTFTELEADEEYTIKVEVKDKAGNKGEKTINVTTEPMPDIETEEGVLTFNPIKWENEKASTIVSTNTEYTIQYQVNSIEGTWTQVAQPGESIKIENLKHSDKIYARLTDGINVTKTAIVKIEDKIVPELELKETQITTKTITAEVEAQDKESGIDTNATYTFFIKKSNEEDENYQEKQNTTSKSCTFTELKANEEYTIKVEVSDKAGNKGEKTINVTTDPMPDIETQEGVLTFTPIKWENGKASTTISTNTQFKIEYQVNSTEGTWMQATNGGENVLVTNLNHNDKVYARLTDEINVTKTAMITILDKVVPKLEVQITRNTTNTVISIVTAEDKESGIDENATYKFSIKKANEQDSSYLQEQDTTSKSCTFTELKANQEYTIKVEVLDKAGNKGEKTINVTTKEMETATGAYYTPITWTNENVTITLPTKPGFTTRYTLDGTAPTKTSTEYSQPFIVSNNCTITYIYTDGTNIGGAGTANVTNIDKEKPKIKQDLTASEVTTKGFKVSVRVQDEESGLGKIIWYHKKSNEDSYTPSEEIYTELNGNIAGTTTEEAKSKIYDNLTSGESYNIYAEVYDVAGNKVRIPKEGTIEETVLKIDGQITLSANSGTYTNGENTFIVTNNISGGTLKVASSNTNIATATISGNTITVTPGTTEGTATITITSEATGTYNEATAEYTAIVGHHFASKTTTDDYLVSAASCNNAATYYYKCIRCSEKGTETYTIGNELGHNAVAGGTLKTAATCTSPAVYYHKCSRCGINLSTTYTSGNALGHNATTGGTLKTAATCTSPAEYYHKCSRCGINLSTTYKSGNALGHNATTGGTLKTAATCTSPAEYYHKCSRCGVDLSTTYTSGNALGHNIDYNYAQNVIISPSNNWSNNFTITCIKSGSPFHFFLLDTSIVTINGHSQTLTGGDHDWVINQSGTFSVSVVKIGDRYIESGIVSHAYYTIKQGCRNCSYFSYRYMDSI